MMGAALNWGGPWSPQKKYIYILEKIEVKQINKLKEKSKV
jgi:hypothetical protein